eukprot:scaffold9166_cov123-Skeletonema_dohrnii-CCMP3373.AAC.3
MSSPSSNAADIGILAQNQPNSDDASSASEEPEFTSRFDVYESIEYGTNLCGNCCYADIADGSTTSPALPSIVGLRISGVGNVPLPISDHHGNEIKKRATYKKEDSGEVYGIEANKIKILNPQWDESLKKLVETVAYKLGVNPSHLTAALGGLIYMERGGYIERRCDDGDEDDILGSLIIQLPSKFTGGELTISNSAEDEDADEESFKFTLGAGEEAAYSCHFACHFSDCEYEMAKLRSGSRVLLRYSLFYKQVDAKEMPKAGMVNECRSLFEESLYGLPPSDRMVLIPLETEYDGLPLAKFGITALSQEHRQKAEALKAAGADWELLIVNAKLVHSCSYGGHSDDTTIIEIFDDNGNRVTEEMSWLAKTIDFSSIEHDDGMLLAFDHDDVCVSNWGACKSRSGAYTSKQTYRATFLLSYDPEFETELKCLGGNEEVAEVCKKIVETRDYGLFDRLLTVVEAKEKSKFDVNSCQMLLQMLIKSRKKTTSRVALVNKILSGLTSSEEPDELLYDTIIDAVEKLGHDELGDAIEALLNDALRKKDKSICFFLKRMEFALKVNTRIEGGAGLNYLEAATNDLSRHANTRMMNSTGAATASTILDMISTYHDIDLTSVVEACLNYFHRGTAQQFLQTMMIRTHLLKQLIATNKFGSLQSSLVEFAADFARRATHFHRHDVKATLEGERKDMFIQAAAFLIEFGTQNNFDRFGKLPIKSVDLFSVFINAVLDTSGQELLRDVLNKCLLQYSITAVDTSISSWTVRKPDEPDILPTPSLHVKKVFELYPNVVQTVDKDKRLPLHYAADSSTASFEVVMEVFKAYKDAASMRDPMTGLFPFQLAASNDNVDSSFSLLLANPNLVSSGIKVSDRKRKRSSSA